MDTNYRLYVHSTILIGSNSCSTEYGRFRQRTLKKLFGIRPINRNHEATYTAPWELCLAFRMDLNGSAAYVRWLKAYQWYITHPMPPLFLVFSFLTTLNKSPDKNKDVPINVWHCGHWGRWGIVFTICHNTCSHSYSLNIRIRDFWYSSGEVLSLHTPGM